MAHPKKISKVSWWWVLPFAFSSAFVYGQRPAVDSNSVTGWPELRDGKISNDGRCVVYTTGYRNTDKRSITIRSVDGHFSRIIPQGRYAEFSANSQYAVITLTSDTLLFVSTAGKADSFAVVTPDGSNEPGETQEQVADSTLKKYLWFRSSSGKWVIYYNSDEREYYAYDVKNKSKVNLTAALPVQSYDSSHYVDSTWYVYDPQGWTANDRYVLIRFEDDLWFVDPAGRNKPISITNGYGRKHNITFKLIGSGTGLQARQRLILTGFDHNTKKNGFFEAYPGSGHDPGVLSLCDCTYDIPDNLQVLETPPRKAKNAPAYLVSRMSATESINYFYTTDFRKFVAVSDNYPERKVSWLKSELVNFNTTEGKKSQGILYTPEDFDSSKRYPVIIHYYERLSDHLNIFIAPDVSRGELNIPWFVSNGYIVFTPDIHYTIGAPGRSALSAVMAAKIKLAEFPFVDTSRIGLQGHSFGGYETNYIVTHTGQFAAACSSAGVADIITKYSTSSGFGQGAEYYETGQGRMGRPVWEIPQSYLDNSPLFNVEKMSTPLLLLYNPADELVEQQQGLVFFNALRRLHKKVWFVQYPGERHNVSRFDHALDFTIRLQQFFDHYLKGKPLPAWMQ